MNTTPHTNHLLGVDKIMDVRTIPCSIKHGLILRTWNELPVGDYFILVNNHDPAPLRELFSAQWPSAAHWEYLACEPEEVHIKISKLKEAGPLPDSIPTSCGGH